MIGFESISDLIESPTDVVIERIKKTRKGLVAEYMFRKQFKGSEGEFYQKRNKYLIQDPTKSLDEIKADIESTSIFIDKWSDVKKNLRAALRKAYEKNLLYKQTGTEYEAIR